MTRVILQRRLRTIYLGLGFIILAALIAKAASLFALPAWLRLGVTVDDQMKLAGGIYDFLKDMAVVFVTIAAAYLAGLLQKRSNFVESLEEEWRRIVATKAALLTYCARDAPTPEQYLAVCEDLSRTLDTMRIAYKNVGETDALVGLYPYAPLHNMRRAMTTIDPRLQPTPSPIERRRVATLIGHSFGALRENFLEELDLEEPTTPVLRSASRRLKSPGRTAEAGALAEVQGRHLDDLKPLDAELTALQASLDRMRDIEDGRNEPPPPR